MQALEAKVATRRVTGAKGTPALLAEPESGGPYPCVVILHERYGLVKHTEDLARRLAGSGYVVLAPDLFYTYPDQEALHRGDVSVVPTDAEVVERIDHVLAHFKDARSADPSRLGLIGVCQTGRYAIADVQRLRGSLEKYDKSYQITIYGDAPHGWLNDTMPGRYRPEIAKRSWAEILEFFERVLANDYDASMIEWKFTSVKHRDYDFSKNVRLE